MPPTFDRRQSLGRLASEEFDVLVIGGGVTGCGVALDATSRCLSTALVEARDIASGTSSKSSKLVHGGLRYLQQHDYRLVYEALHERQRLIDNAPHLVHPLPFLIPLFGKDGVVASSVAKAYSVALWTYDITGGLRIGHRHRRIGSDEALRHFPVLRTDRLVASFLYWDAQADDARLTLTIARSAAERGAAIANYSPVAELVEEAGRVRGAVLEDGTHIRAGVVINAGGVWSEKIASLGGHSAGSPVKIRPAKGIHVAVPADKLPCDFASVLTVPGDRRSVFVVPWAAGEIGGQLGDRATGAPGRFTYIGTTDTDYEGPLDNPQCTVEDVEYLLRAVNAWTSATVTPDDVTGSWAGLRPLISDAQSARTADLSRRHSVTISANGLVTVTGGKLTTYRLMAADTVDAAAKVLDRRIGPSQTKRLRLLGAGAGRPAAKSGHLDARYGTEASDVRALCDKDRSLGEPLSESLPYSKAEAVFAARHEMAYTLEDILSRRTRATILDREAASRAAPIVAALVAPELGWDEAEQALQVSAFRAAVDSDRQAMIAEPEQRAAANL